MGNGHINLPATSPRASAFSRRTALAAGVGLAGLLVGCTDTSGAGGQASGPAEKPVNFDIPKSNIPSGSVSLRWVDSGDQKAEFWKPFFKAYEKVHDNVTVDYKGTNWNTIQQSITLGLQNGTAPDTFQLPSTITSGQAVEQKWLAAFDDFVPDFDKLMSRFPAGTTANGVNIFDGKTYTLSPSSGQRMPNLILSNSELIADTGFDPTKAISWDDFRQMLKKATKNGKGQAYGIIAGLAQNGQLSGPIGTMAKLAGCPGDGGGFNWKTGQYNFTDERTIAAMELFLAIKSDGSFFPGTVSLDAPGARGRFPQGVAAVILQGPWNIRPWLQENASLKLGVGPLPMQDTSQHHKVNFGPGGSNPYAVSAKAPADSLKVIGDMFAYVMSQNGQVNWAQRDGVGDPAYPGMQGNAKIGPQETTAQELANTMMAVAPEPAVRNPDVAVVYKNLKQVTPDFSATCVGLYTGQIKGVKAAFKKLSDASEKALEAAIATATKQGAKVSRDDWVFSDWDPDAPYEKLYTNK